MSKSETWDLIIRPHTRWFELHLREVWRYRDLVILFVKRDFIAQYKQTILGPLWYLIQPVLTTIMFLIIFGRVARIPTDGVDPIVFYLSGITLWTYFSTCLTAISNTFVLNANIFGKVYFPRLVSPLSLVISNLIRFGIQFLLLFSVMIWSALQGDRFPFSWNWFWLPVVLLLISLLALGLGILISSLTTKYRDLNVLITFGIQLAMYATPIAYPLSFIQQSGYAWIINLNPLTPLVELYRYVLFGTGTFTLTSISYSLAAVAIVLLAGLISFNRVEKTFMDTV
jgi:lipopolysaccharide transport system permease protein